MKKEGTAPGAPSGEAESDDAKSPFSARLRAFLAPLPSAAIVFLFGLAPRAALALAAAFATLSLGLIVWHLGWWTADVWRRPLTPARKAWLSFWLWTVLAPIPFALAFPLLGRAGWSSALAHLSVAYAAVFPIALAFDRREIARYSDRLGHVGSSLGAFLLIGFLDGLPLFGAWDMRLIAEAKGWSERFSIGGAGTNWSAPATWAAGGFWAAGAALAALVAAVALRATRLQLLELSKQWRPRPWDEAASAALDEFEKKRRAARRPHGIGEDEPRLGICLSGGGIRSASVCVGALESLDARSAGPSILERTDVVASVSGGGFALGALLTAELDRPAVTEAGGVKTGAVPPPRDEAFWKALRSRLRRAGDYLVRGGIAISSETVRPVVTWALGAFVHLVAGLSFCAAVLFLVYDEGLDAMRERAAEAEAPSEARAPASPSTRVTDEKLRVLRVLLDGYVSFTRTVTDDLYVLPADPPCTKNETAVDRRTPEKYVTLSRRQRACMRTELAKHLPLVNVAGMAASVAFGAFTLFSLSLLVGTFFGARPSARAMRESMLGAAARAGALLAVLLLVVGVLRGTAYVTSFAVIATAIGLVASRLGTLRRIDLAAIVVAVATGELAIESFWPTLTAGIAGVTNAWYEVVVDVLLAPASLAKRYGEVPPTLWAASAAMLAILFGIVIDRRFVGLHDYWKRCIRRGFLLDGEKEHPACDRSLHALARADVEVGSAKHSELTIRGLPMPVFVTAVHTNDRGASTEVRGTLEHGAAEPRRSTARFDIAPDRVGSTPTGWASAETCEKAELSMATALAISGAAVNGQANESVKRFLGGLISLFQFGLGVWVPNPAYAGDPAFRRTPHFWTRYGLLDALGRNDGSETLVLLSDGGHHDNLGLTALLHRGVDVAVVVDAARDADYAFEDLTRAIALARLEDGWSSDISSDAIAAMRPDEKTKLSGEAIVSFTMSKPGRRPVEVVYVKACVTPAAHFELKRYRERRPEFPHDSTADQMFDAEQLDAYYLLGRHLGSEAAPVIAGVLDAKRREGTAGV